MKLNIYIFFFLTLLPLVSCKKVVQINPPTGSITTSQVFADSTDAASAIAGIYSNMSYVSPGFGNCLITLYLGMSADELLAFTGSANELALSSNTVLANNGLTGAFWTQGYPILYQPNAIIEGLQASTSLSQSVKEEFIGEAEWFRAFINFYLVNLYGPIPLITSIDYKSNALASRSPTSLVFASIINDLKDAQSKLPTDYSEGGGERVRVNKWAATALLARAYLYTGNYSDAAAQASAIINNTGLYSLDSNLNHVFLADSPEVILQWYNNSNVNTNTLNATDEGWQIIPQSSTSPPFYYLSNPILNAFETGDLRKTAWIDSTSYNGITYYYPYKYKVGSPQAQYGAPVTEYTTVLRLAEQYLIRAEAEANGATGGTAAAIADLNVIRKRAGLPNLSDSLTQSQVVAAVAQERRIELFAEWGHRWLDLKRTGQVGVVFSTIPYKSAYQPFQQLYPIPVSELQADPNLTQNPGYSLN
jgi:starch-binding outer membrane protein, SusD/RagB family